MSEVERITIAELRAKVNKLEDEKKDLKMAWRTSVKFGYELEKENEKLRKQLEDAEKAHICCCDVYDFGGGKCNKCNYKDKYSKEGEK